MSSILHSGLWRPDILKSQPWTPAVQKKKIDFDPDEVSPFWSTPEGIQILTSLLEKYSEDQPRDSHGRFASGESGDTKDKELASHLSYISNAVESFRAAGGEVKLLDPGFDTDELEKMASNLTSTMDKIYDSYTGKLMTSSEAAQVDKLTTALNAMRAAVTDTLSGITENVFVAYDKNGSPVAALSFNEPMGESLSIGYLGSTLTVAGAGTALQYELAQYAANEHVGVDSVSGMGSQNYHELIGRTVDNAGNSTWTDEQVQQIADLNLPSLQKLFKYDEDQERDYHGRFAEDTAFPVAGMKLGGEFQSGDVITWGRHGDVTIVSIKPEEKPGSSYHTIFGIKEDGSKVKFNVSGNKHYPTKDVTTTSTPQTTVSPPEINKPETGERLNYGSISPELGKVIADAGIQTATDKQWNDFQTAVKNGTPVDPATWNAVGREISGINKIGITFETEYDYDRKEIESHYDENGEYVSPYYVLTSETLTVTPIPKEQQEENEKSFGRTANGFAALLSIARDTVERNSGVDEEDKGYFYARGESKLNSEQVATLTKLVGRVDAVSTYVNFGTMKANDFPSGQMPYTSLFVSSRNPQSEVAQEYMKYGERISGDDLGKNRNQIAENGYNRLVAELTFEQMQGIRESYAKELQGRVPVVKVDSSVVEKILKGASLGNLFTENKTGAGAGAGERYRTIRKLEEADSMGYRLDASGENRPVYGIMETKDSVSSHVGTSDAEIDLALGRAVGLNAYIREVDKNGDFSGYRTVTSLQDAIDANIRSDNEQAQKILDDRASGGDKLAAYPEMYSDERLKSFQEHTVLNERLAEIQDIKDNPQNYVAVAGRDLNWDHNKWFDTYEIRSKQSIQDEIQSTRQKVEDTKYSRRSDDKKTINSLIGNLKSYKMYELALPDGSLNKDTVAWQNTQAHDDLSHFGDSTIVLKDSVLANSTVTPGDSLDYNQVTAIPYELAVSADPSAPVPMHERMDVGATGPEDKIPGLNGEPPYTGAYYEVQIGGTHPTASDIEKIIFTNGRPSDAAVKKLESLGIYYEIAYPNFDSKNFTKIDSSLIPEKPKR